MKKRILGVIAAGCAAVLMLSGFDSAMTVEELQEKTKAAVADVGSMWVVVKGTADANLSMSQNTENGASMDIPINGNLDMDYRFNLEPFQMKVGIQYSGEAMGQGMNGGMEVYLLENEDGSGQAYMGNLVGGQMQWSANDVDAQQVAQMKDMVVATLNGDASSLSALSESGNAMDAAALQELVTKYQDQFADLVQISPEYALKDDTECYELTADVSGDVLFQMMTDILSASGQGPDDASLQMAQAAISGLRAKIDTLVDAETYLPAYGTIDLGESDFSQIADLVAGSMAGSGTDMTANVNVNALNMSANFTFNEPVQIEVPAEAEAARTAGGTDVTGNPEDLIGGLLTGGTDTTGGGSDLTGGQDADTDAPVQNADGTYLLQYEDYFGNLKSANVAVPDGLALSYGNSEYLTFSNDNYSYQVSYSLYSMDTPEQTVESDLDTTYYESDSSYSDVTRTDVMQTTLADGTPVSYGFKGYTYDGYSMGGTYAALKAGDAVVKFEIEKEDENRNTVPATEQEVQQLAALISPAA